MKSKIFMALSAVMLCFCLTACGSENAYAPSVAEEQKAAVQEKIEQSANEDKAQPDTSADSTQSSITDEKADGSNILVAYFSRADENYSVGTVDVGNTQIIADYIADELGADSFNIETVMPYPADYDECCDAAKQELNDKARPEISGTVENMEKYDIVFLGYPIWWGDMPMAMYTFIESYDWSDKVVIPFNTHEGSGDAGTYSTIASVLSDAQVLDSMAIQGKTAQEFSSDTQKSVREWLDYLGL